MQSNWRFRTATIALSSVLAIPVALAAATVTTPAFAQKAPVSEAAKALARKNYKAGEAKFSSGNYAEALELYQQAEATIPIPQTKYKIAVCYDRLGKPGEAARWYQVFLDNIPADKADKLADNIADARAKLAAMKSAPAQVRLVYAPATARVLVSIDGAAPANTGAQLGLPPGHHRLTFQADGFDPYVAEIDLVSGDSKEIRFAFQPSRAGVVAVVPSPPPVVGPAGPPPGALPPPVPPPHRRSNVPAYVLIGAAGAGIIVGSAFGAIALSDKSNFNKNPTNAGADTTHNHALVSDVSFAIAGALGVTGIVLLVTNLPPRSDVTTGKAFITPYAGPTGAGARAGLAF